MFYRSRKRAPVYDSIWIDIVVSDEPKKLNKEFGYDDDIEGWFACVFKHQFRDTSTEDRFFKSITVVLNPNHPGSKITNKIIVHEVIHLKNRIFNLVGYECKPINDEHEAYYSEMLYDMIETFYNKCLEKEKKLTLKTEENGPTE